MDSGRVDRVLELRATSSRIGPGLGQAPATPRLHPRAGRSRDDAARDRRRRAERVRRRSRSPGRPRGRDVIITPHPGEMARLLGMSIDEVQANRLEIARNFAGAHHVYVVLKGHRTLDRRRRTRRSFINPTGNPGMATGGTGDVLTGMIAAWLAQLLDAEAACKLAVYLHGMAGDLAEADEGESRDDRRRRRRAPRRRDPRADGRRRTKRESRSMNDIGSPADGALEASTLSEDGDDRGLATRLGRTLRPVAVVLLVRGSRRGKDGVRARPGRRARRRPRRRSAARRSRSIQEYPGRPRRCYHVDLYRLTSRARSTISAWTTSWPSEGIVAIEWAEAVAAAGPAAAASSRCRLRMTGTTKSDPDRCTRQNAECNNAIGILPYGILHATPTR